MIGYIYKHTSPNGKSYIGQTYNKLGYSARWKYGSGYEYKTIIGRAIRKYGWYSFEHVILHTVVKDDLTELISELNHLEEREIADNNTITPYGYNNSFGGGNMEVLLSTRKKQSEITKKRYINGEIIWNKGLPTCEQPRYGKKQSDTQKEAARVAMKNSWSSGKITGHAIGVFKHSDGTKNKISLIQRNYSEDKKNIIRIKRNETMLKRYGKKSIGAKNTLGKMWFTDGINSVISDQCPPGYYRGRTIPANVREKISNTLKEYNRTKIILGDK